MRNLKEPRVLQGGKYKDTRQVNHRCCETMGWSDLWCLPVCSSVTWWPMWVSEGSLPRLINPVIEAADLSNTETYVSYLVSVYRGCSRSCCHIDMMESHVCFNINSEQSTWWITGYHSPLDDAYNLPSVNWSWTEFFLDTRDLFTHLDGLHHDGKSQLSITC